jgi:cob(I)alamin adenosyltransferase
MVILFTGNGKGKTTAALGQAVRALGRGKGVLMIQFIKGPWKSGEDEFSELFKIPREKFQLRKMGLGFVGILGDKLPREEHEKAAHDALEFFKKEMKNDTWSVFILDEVNVAISLNLITVGDVLVAIKGFPEDKLLVLTGRGAPQELIDDVDLATEMKEVKHPFQEGKLAKFGIEF